MRKVLIAIYCVILVIDLAESPLPTLAQDNNKYAYMVFARYDQSILKLIDPSNLTDVQSSQLTIPKTKQLLQRWSLSPKGNWLALIYGRPNESDAIRLINISSREVRDIVPQGRLSPAFNDYVGFNQAIAWSSDGNVLAFIDFTESGRTVYLYTINNKNLTKLSTDRPQPLRLALSGDGLQIAVESEWCIDREHCDMVSIDVYDITTQTKRKSIDNLFALSKGGSIGTVICALTWSPMSQFISFVSSCDGTISDIPHELYVWDTQSNTIKQLTHFTEELLKESGVGGVNANYHMLWYNEQMLLVGVEALSNKSAQVQTVAYQMPEGLPIVISLASVQEWAVNPLTQEIAFRESSLFNLSDMKPQISSVTVGNLSGKTLRRSKSVTPGCNLAWSPDGTILAYTLGAGCENHRRSFSLNPIQSFSFVRVPTGQQIQYTIPSNETSKDTVIVPLGWVK